MKPLSLTDLSDSFCVSPAEVQGTTPGAILNPNNPCTPPGSDENNAIDLESPGSCTDNAINVDSELGMPSDGENLSEKVSDNGASRKSSLALHAILNFLPGSSRGLIEEELLPSAAALGEDVVLVGSRKGLVKV